MTITPCEVFVSAMESKILSETSAKFSLFAPTAFKKLRPRSDSAKLSVKKNFPNRQIGFQNFLDQPRAFGKNKIRLASVTNLAGKFYLLIVAAGDFQHRRNFVETKRLTFGR